MHYFMHYFTGSTDSEMNDDQKKEKLTELRKKEREIQDVLGQKLTELKEICLREAVRANKSFTFFLFDCVVITLLHSKSNK